MEVAITGLTKLEQLELVELFGPEVVRLEEHQDVGYHSLEVAAALVVLAYPVVKALAGMIARDHVHLTYRIDRPDGSSETGSIAINKASDLGASGDDLKKYLEQLKCGSDGSAG